MFPLFAAITFLTRIPLSSKWNFDARDVGKSTIFFPLVGAGIGGAGAIIFNLFILWFGHQRVPSLLTAAIITLVTAWITGALHLDGLADMADGFGGGHTREDVLRIMRDHVIGAYGAVALILLLLIKISALSLLIEHSIASSYLIVAPALARWATVPLGKFLPYARRDGAGLGAAVTDYVGWNELLGATIITSILLYLIIGWHGIICWIIVYLTTYINGRLCMRRIGGVTGDTLGANTEICEMIVLLTGTFLIPVSH
jgi:adenosylcobinamide-GDP ribazoletransferase